SARPCPPTCRRVDARSSSWEPGKGPAMSTDVGTTEDRTSTGAARPERTNGGGRTGGPPAAVARTGQRTGESGTGWWMLAAAMGSVLALAVALVAVVMAGSSD